jgi:tetratricopeptide (TPR) repeat protein
MAYKLDAKRKTRSNRSVHLINLAEAHLSLYDFNQAEKYALGATKHFHRFLHSTPWEFLVGLYLDLGRYNDAWNALRQSHQWYMQQAPRLSESVYAGNQMTKSVFFLAMGNPKVAMQLLERIRDRPDRRGHMSADTRQFVVGERLLRYHARRLQIELLREKAPTVGWFPRWGLWLQRKWLGLQAWRDGASVRRALADQGFLQRSLSPYRSGSFSMPNSAVPFWMVGSVIPLVGPAVVKDAIAGVRQQEMKQSPRVRAFFLALEAEAAYRQGQQKEAQALVQSALQKIPPQLGPLRARLLVMDGVLARERGEWNGMKQAFAQVIRKDGSPFRLLNVPFPVVSVSATAGDATRLAKMLFASPRFMLHHAGFKLQVERTGQWMRATLLDDLGSVMHRFKLTRNKKESEKAFLRRFVVTFQSDLFSPHFQLSRRQIFSLDDSLLRSSRETMIMKKSDLLPPEERKPADR